MSYEYSLVLFTVLGQLAAGIALLVCLTGLHEHPAAERRAWRAVLALGVVAMVAAASHLHSLGPAFFSLNGLGSSWISREICLGAVFGVLVLLRLTGVLPEKGNWLTGAAGVCFVLAMAQIYAGNRSAPLWNTGGSVLSFVASMLLLGGAGIMAVAPEARQDGRLRVSLGVSVVGGLFALALPAFWLGGMQASLDPMLLGVFSTAAVCMTLTQTVCYAAGGVIMVCGMPRRSAFIYLGAALLLAGTIVGRMLFYAANIRLGF
ncbi:dimethyl sulfoxide reductase anchor subunit family protein [Desulfocurvus sp. DL9XJH121]